MGVSRDGVDDDGRVVLSGPSDFDCLGSVVDDDHFLEIDFALEVLSSLKYIATHFLSFLHLVTYIMIF